jgi:CubicO group peptidase (beta-lactamase class C family)
MTRHAWWMLVVLIAVHAHAQEAAEGSSAPAQSSAGVMAMDWVRGDLYLTVESDASMAGTELVCRAGEEELARSAWTVSGSRATAVLIMPGSRPLPESVELVQGTVTLQEAVLSPALTARVRVLQEALVQPANKWDHVFEGQSFPEIRWADPVSIARYWGDIPLTVRWFDAAGTETAAPATPGWYAAWAEGTTPDGRTVRKGLTLCRVPDAWPVWTHIERAAISMPSGADKALSGSFDGLVGPLLTEYFCTAPIGAALTAALIERHPQDPATSKRPDIADQERWLVVKRRNLPGLPAPRPLAAPKKRAGTVLQPGSAESAGLNAADVEQVRALCREWANAEGIPFIVVLARGGSIFLHESFAPGNGPVPAVETPSGIASVTKALTGLLMARFVDQGLVDPDAPVGSYLPGFPDGDTGALTVRHCATHTSGFEGHGMFGGLSNPWLESTLGLEADRLEPGLDWEYNGMGTNLLGRVMEMVSGRHVFALMDEGLVKPLGLEQTIMGDDLAYGARMSALDMAKLAQLLLNKGAYGETELFSEATMNNAVAPRLLEDLFPEFEGEARRWGLGVIPMHYPLPDNNSGLVAVDEEETALSEHAIGRHGASGAFFLADPARSLVVAMARNDKGPAYDDWLLRFLRAVEQAVPDARPAE